MKRVTRLLLYSLLLILAGTTGSRSAESRPEVIAYVALIQGHATARLEAQPERVLERFSPLYGGDRITVAAGGKITARYVQTDQTLILTSATPAATRHLTALPAVKNDTRTRLWLAISDAQRSSFSQAGRKARTAVRDGVVDLDRLETLTPRSQVLRDDVVFRWTGPRTWSYQVALYDASGHAICTSPSVSGTHWAYPASAPRLAPECEYTWSVWRTGRPDHVTSRFETVSAHDEHEIRARLSEIERFTFIDGEERRLTRAAYLEQQGLYANATEELTPLGEAASTLVHVLRWNAWDALHERNMACFEWKWMGGGVPITVQWDEAGTP